MLENLSSIAPDPLFGLQSEFQQCSNPKKINLGIGIYFGDDKKPFVMPSISKSMAQIDTTNNNYVAMRGDVNFLQTFEKIIFGEASFASVQTVGGTHGVWVVGELLRRAKALSSVIIGTPTWSNHYALLKGAEFITIPHLEWNDGIPHFAHQAYIDALKNAEQGSAIVLHGGKTHNPTGINASVDQWEEIIDLANEKKIFIIVDYAYFGMGDGFVADSIYAKKIMEKADQAAIIFSFSKNATLYKHRLGAVFVKDIYADRVLIDQNLENIIRESISNPPAFGAMVMQKVLQDYQEEWKNDLETLRLSLEHRKTQLVSHLGNKFSYINEARGMFTLLGITPEVVEQLKREHSIFLPTSGRINFGGLFPQDIETVAQAILHCSS